MSFFSPPFLIKNEADHLEKPNVQPASNNVQDDIINISCGHLNGRLHMRMFVCPGIHQRCIQLQETHEMITPKDLTIRACKEKQKDWKGSIRIGKKSLRRLMEIGVLDYYNHKQLCSLKCQSRNHIKRIDNMRTRNACLKREKSNDNISPAPLPPLSFPLGSNGAYSPNTFFLSAQSNGNQENSGPVACLIPREVNKSAIQPSCDFSMRNFNSGPNLEHQLLNLLHLDPISFWKEVRHSNIFKPTLSLIEKSFKDLSRSEIIDDPIATMTLSRILTAMNLQYEVIHMFTKKRYESLHSSGVRSVVEPSSFTLPSQKGNLAQADTVSSESIIKDDSDYLHLFDNVSVGRRGDGRRPHSFEEDESQMKKMRYDTHAANNDCYTMTYL